MLLNERNPTAFTEDHLIVCEGRKDAAFIDMLLGQNGIIGCDVGYPTRPTGGMGGSAIEQYLLSSRLNPKFTTLRAVMLVGDTDTNPAGQFLELSRCLGAVGLASPPAAGAIASAATSTMIVMIPSPAEHGTLEHILLRATLRQKPHLRACINAFRSCAKARGRWTRNKNAKRDLQLIIACHCTGDPCVSVAWIWNKTGNPIPKTSSSYRTIVASLKRFATI